MSATAALDFSMLMFVLVWPLLVDAADNALGAAAKRIVLAPVHAASGGRFVSR